MKKNILMKIVTFCSYLISVCFFVVYFVNSFTVYKMLGFVFLLFASVFVLVDLKMIKKQKMIKK